ncbi:lysozyme [Cyclobacterium jeungdonense]|uniref:Lysozyme n=1 Tax=Cyclobacterium jeungdonense TaxID=708087 RepID=A0ABT8CAQ6_9BACT|nr:lysozyme [Cyclobacterium jeungdonense]MDN3688693.1 lysozyme [Cyclobacterium jeungdonense]
MRTTSTGINLIKHSEGLRLEAYICPAGIPTIGYGSTSYPDGKPVKMGDSITESQASQLLQDTVASFEKGVRRLVTRDLTPNQFSALVSFAFNLGLGALERSTLLRKVNTNPSDPFIREEFHRWVHAGGKVLPGLVTRRKAEADLYFTES